MIRRKGGITRADLRHWPYQVVLPAEKVRGLKNSEVDIYHVGGLIGSAANVLSAPR
jgi:hypothetical protein